MKLLKIIVTSLGVVAASYLNMSCDKTNSERIGTVDTDFSNTTLVQVFNATVGSAGATNVFVDGSPVTGAAVTYGSVFPATYAFKVKPGLRSFSIRDVTAGSTQTPIIFAENMEVGKNYTIFTYDTSTSAKQITIVNNIITPSDSTARVKFANFLYWKTGTAPAVDVYSVKRGQNIFSGILPTQATDYIPFAFSSADSLIVRTAGTGIALDTAVFSFTPKRNYTLIFRGRYANNEAGGATAPRTLSSFANK